MQTLLIADDMGLNRHCLGLLLKRQGYRVLEADDGDEALRISRAERPDVAIVDLFMPAMDGFEYARHVRSDPSIAGMPIIFFSSTFSPTAADILTRLLGVKHMLQKSCDDQQILDAVRDAVNSPVPPPAVVVGPDEFNREHLRVITDKLSTRMEGVLSTLGDCLGVSEPDCENSAGCD